MNRPSWSYVGDCLRDNTFSMKESNYRPPFKFKLKLLKVTANFEYKNSFLVKETYVSDVITANITANFTRGERALVFNIYQYF
jgi:hypothetical protein